MSRITLPTDRIREKYHAVLQRIRSVHLKCFPGCPDPLFLISDAYPGVWLEHVYDAIRWAELAPRDAQVAAAQVRLFLDRQKPDGQFPCYVLDMSNPNAAGYAASVGYGQIQECVSFTQLCLEAALLTNDDALLREAYDKCVRWDAWLCSHRMTLGSGLIELFCEYDTGHDNSPRFSDIPKGCPHGDARNCPDLPFLPLRAPDMNAVFYGSRMALSRMAARLGRRDEEQLWRERAAQVRDALFRICFDPEDLFFYDADRSGHHRKFRSILLANLFQEHLLDGDLAERIYQRYMKNPQEFWAPFPFPSMSLSDPHAVQNLDGNSWGFYSQGLTALRALRWMDHYGKSEDLEELMRRWIFAFVRQDEIPFGQELHPVSGRPSVSSRWYSSSMLFFVSAVRRLQLLSPQEYHPI